ncbi:MAG: sigma-E processing peptidase SpoIIGA, partial [Clostridia bacterium]
MDAAALALTGTLGRTSIHPARILAAAAAGTLPTLVVLLAPSGALEVIDLVLTPWVMVGIAFRPGARRQWIMLTATLYAVTVAMGGVTLALTSAGLPLVMALALGPVGGLLLARWWRDTVSRPLRDRRGRVMLRLGRRGKVVVLDALWDSGNRLYTAAGTPVVVVAHDGVRDLMTPEERTAEKAGGARDGRLAGDTATVRATTVAGSLLLPILDVDTAEVEVNGEWKALKPLVIGISDSWSGRARGIEALVNPDWVLERASRYA